MKQEEALKQMMQTNNMVLDQNHTCLLIDLIDVDLFDELLQLDIQAHITSSALIELEGDE